MIPSSILWVFCRCFDTGIHIKFEKELEFFENHITALSEVLKGNFFLYRGNKQYNIERIFLKKKKRYFENLNMEAGLECPTCMNKFQNITRSFNWIAVSTTSSM